MVNKIKFGGVIFSLWQYSLGFLDWAILFFLPLLSEQSLADIGDGTKTVDEEMVRQLRQNNIGPAEMLLPLASVNRRQEFANAIESKKRHTPNSRFREEEYF